MTSSHSCDAGLTRRDSASPTYDSRRNSLSFSSGVTLPSRVPLQHRLPSTLSVLLRLFVSATGLNPVPNPGTGITFVKDLAVLDDLELQQLRRAVQREHIEITGWPKGVVEFVLKIDLGLHP